MADDSKAALGRPAPGSSTSSEEQDVLFRFQMALAHYFFGYYKHALVLVGIVLVVIGGIGLYRDHVEELQEGWQGRLSEIAIKVPPVDPMAMHGLAPADDRSDTARMASLETAGKEFEAVGAEATGTASAMAWLRAAEMWKRSGKADLLAGAYEKAHAAAAPGAVGWAARAGLASTRAAAGDVDGAASLLREAANGKDFYAERGLYELGQLYAENKRPDDARKAFEEFGSRFADSTLADEVAAAVARLGSGT